MYVSKIATYRDDSVIALASGYACCYELPLLFIESNTFFSSTHIQLKRVL